MSFWTESLGEIKRLNAHEMLYAVGLVLLTGPIADYTNQANLHYTVCSEHCQVRSAN